MEGTIELVDIIVPVYNQAHCIKRCIQSIISQTYENWHLIIVNDGSTDQTLEICNQYPKLDSRIDVIDKGNGGVASARNAGLKYAVGTKILFIDSDDYIKSDYIDMLISQCFDYDLVVSGSIWLDESENIIYKNIPANYESCKSEEYIRYIHTKDIFKFFTSPWGKLFKASIVNDFQIQFRDMEYGEDTCFVFDYLYHSTCIKIISDAKYCYFHTHNSLSRKHIDSLWEKLKDINAYCRKDFYELYDSIWNYMYLRIIKIALASETDNITKFKKQFNEIRQDKEYKLLQMKNCVGLVDKLFCAIIKLNLKLVCFLSFYIDF